MHLRPLGSEPVLALLLGASGRHARMHTEPTGLGWGHRAPPGSSGLSAAVFPALQELSVLRVQDRQQARPGAKRKCETPVQND